MVPPVISIQADSAPPPLRQPAGRTSSRVHTPPRLRGGREGSTDHSTAARTSARVHTPPRLQGGQEGATDHSIAARPSERVHTPPRLRGGWEGSAFCPSAYFL